MYMLDGTDGQMGWYNKQARDEGRRGGRFIVVIQHGYNEQRAERGEEVLLSTAVRYRGRIYIYQSSNEEMNLPGTTIWTKNIVAGLPYSSLCALVHALVPTQACHTQSTIKLCLYKRTPHLILSNRLCCEHYSGAKKSRE